MAIKMDEVGVGSAIVAWLVAKLDGKGKIAMIEGHSGAQTFRNIAQGFTTQIESASGIEVVARFEAPLRREEGLRITEDILTAHPDLQAIRSTPSSGLRAARFDWLSASTLSETCEARTDAG